MHAQMMQEGLTPREMFRLNDPRRMFATVKQDVLPFCYERQDAGALFPTFDFPPPPPEDQPGLPPYLQPEASALRVWVSSCAGAALLLEARAEWTEAQYHPLVHEIASGRRRFTHVFIDEAGQALVAESLVPLTLAEPDASVLLAGALALRVCAAALRCSPRRRLARAVNSPACVVAACCRGPEAARPVAAQQGRGGGPALPLAPRGEHGCRPARGDVECGSRRPEPCRRPAASAAASASRDAAGAELPFARGYPLSAVQARCGLDTPSAPLTSTKRDARAVQVSADDTTTRIRRPVRRRLFYQGTLKPSAGADKISLPDGWEDVAEGGGAGSRVLFFGVKGEQARCRVRPTRPVGSSVPPLNTHTPCPRVCAGRRLLHRRGATGRRRRGTTHSKQRQWCSCSPRSFGRRAWRRRRSGASARTEGRSKR